MFCFNCNQVSQGETRLSTSKGPQLIAHHVSVKEFTLQHCYICVLLWHDFITNDQRRSHSQKYQSSGMTCYTISESEEGEHRVSQGSFLMVFTSMLRMMINFS